eukprot:gene26864-32333_t
MCSLFVGESGVLCRVFLGTFTPKLDDKGRLTLPAKFRDELAGGLMITKSQDHSLAIYPRDEFVKLARKAAAAPRNDPAARAYVRALAAGTDEQHADAQGRITLSADHRRYANLSKECVVTGSVDYLEIWDLAAWERRRAPGECREASARKDPDALPQRQVLLRAGTSKHSPSRTVIAFSESQHLFEKSSEIMKVGAGAIMVDHEVNEPSDADGFAHVPVLLHRADDLLGPAITAVGDGGAGAYMIDATLGLGGHSEFFLGKYPGLHLIGLDRDTNALRIASERLAPFADRTTFVHTTYDGIEDALEQAGLPSTESVHAILFDLGVSSMQLDEADRGFAYSIDAPLDMRMDQTVGLTAAEVLNTYSHGDLARILSTYGEERFAGKIASEILRQREREPFTTSAALVELLYRTIPAATRRTGGHPAKRTFQA